MTLSSLLRKKYVFFLLNTITVIGQRRLTNEKIVTCTLTMLNSDKSWIFVINISFENGLNFSDKM